MRVAAVVVNYHTGPLLRDCLRRVLRCPELAELVLVDNGSTPGEIDALLGELNDRRIVRLDLPSNPGFAVACNRGARASQSPWLLFLNPDCLVEPDTLERLGRSARADESLAMLGALLVDTEGRPDPASLRRDPLPRRAIATALGLDRLAAIEGVSIPIPADTSAPVPVDAISGALMLVRRDAFNAARGFDEGYFMHAEDLDLCRRVRELDFQVCCDPGVRVVHVKGVSSRRRPLRVELAKHRGLLRYFDKFDAPRTAWPLRV
ncbi:MAG TPA: glycosyltransferase family 2 protein, partial [Xanthomonadales bacterium]|nr:glycosyltransferase family 2 protein [Xanthomonadales bacterium]